MAIERPDWGSGGDRSLATTEQSGLQRMLGADAFGDGTSHSLSVTTSAAQSPPADTISTIDSLADGRRPPSYSNEDVPTSEQYRQMLADLDAYIADPDAAMYATWEDALTFLHHCWSPSLREALDDFREENPDLSPPDFLREFASFTASDDAHLGLWTEFQWTLLKFEGARRALNQMAGREAN